MRYQLLSAATLYLLLFTSAHADCDAILNESLLSTNQVRDENAARFAFAQSFCNKTYQQMGSSDSFSIGVKYKVFGGNFNQSESSFNSWKQENCGSTSSEQSTQNFRFAATSALNDAAIRAWEQCNQQINGLTCTLSRADDPEDVTLMVNYRVDGNVNAKVTRSYINNGENPESNNK